MTILILFHTMCYCNLKSLYLGYICNHMCKEFPKRLPYSHFVERWGKVVLHLLLFLQTCVLGNDTSISIIDSTPLVLCHIRSVNFFF